MEALNKALDLIMNHAMPAASTMAIILEVGMRLIPSEKPLSIMHVVADSLKKVGEICKASGDLLDKVLPQKLK